MINQVALTGRLVSSPELKRIGDKYVCNFTLAVRERNDRNKCNFIGCVIWGKQAEALVEYTSKGDLIGVEGRLQQRTFEVNGSPRSVIEVIAHNIIFLSTKRSDLINESDNDRNYTYYDIPSDYEPKNSVVEEKPTFVIPDDEDLPF